MANGHVEIYDPFSKHSGLAGSKHCDHKSTSASDSMEDTLEFRLLMAYAKRRRTIKESPSPDRPAAAAGGTDANGSSPQTPEKTEDGETKKKKRKRRKGWKHLPGIFSCISSRTRDDGPSLMTRQQNEVDDRCDDFRCAEVKEEEEEEELWKVARRLTALADEIQFIPPDVETDAPEDVNVEKMIGLLLRDAGDRLNETELKDAAVATELFWNYSFFKLLMTTLLTRMGLQSPDPDSPGPKASPKTQIAVTCEVTSRLSAVNSLPGNRLLAHGARYLQHYYSSWAQQQGGYEEAFYSDDEDDIQ